MRPSAWFRLAVLSAGAALCGAATRPHYGGTLRVEMRAALPELDPANADAAPLTSLVFEPLVRLDANGAPQPCLALSWHHDAAWRRWQFNLRPGVKFHDGFAMAPATVVASLEASLADVGIAASGDTITIRTEHSAPGLPLALAHNSLVFARDADGALVGTGPFRVTSWDPGRRAMLAANEDYWGGRAFVDAIEVRMGRGLRDQLVDLEIGKTDVAELGPTELRRANAHAWAVWSSSPVDLIALEFAPGRAADPRLREALALSIDRAAMHSVLLQKQGEITAALLPGWISGHAFVFPTAPDLARARALAAALPASARTLTLSYDPSMAAARPLAERVAVNAHDAGLSVQVTPQNPQADVRLTGIRLRSLDPARALAGFAAELHLEPPAAARSAEALYQFERRLLADFRLIPLFHLPEFYGAASRVRVFQAPPVTRLGDWRFADVWLAGRAP